MYPIDTVVFDDVNAAELPRAVARSSGRLDASGCRGLRRLPASLPAVDLRLRGCVSLEALPEGLPARMARLDISGCEQLTALPASVRSIAHLNVSGCPIRTLPAHLEVIGTLELADSGLVGVPAGVPESALRWRSIPIDARVAFEPDAITAEDILCEENAERRRVLIERVGYERFLDMTSADVIDEDVDRGGPRTLVRAWALGDEDIVCLLVRCPSTQHRYALRVPPHVTSCHQAAAWIAGFDDPADYAPIIET